MNLPKTSSSIADPNADDLYDSNAEGKIAQTAADIQALRERGELTRERFVEIVNSAAPLMDRVHPAFAFSLLRDIPVEWLSDVGFEEDPGDSPGEPFELEL